MTTAVKTLARLRRHKRVRNKLAGDAESPRLAVFRSNRNIYAQIIDDASGVTLVSASTLDGDIKSTVGSLAGKEAAEKVGALLAKRALDKGVQQVIFDRGGYLFHGRVKALADAARKSGLKF